MAHHRRFAERWTTERRGGVHGGTSRPSHTRSHGARGHEEGERRPRRRTTSPSDGAADATHGDRSVARDASKDMESAREKTTSDAPEHTHGGGRR